MYVFIMSLLQRCYIEYKRYLQQNVLICFLSHKQYKNKSGRTRRGKQYNINHVPTEQVNIYLINLSAV